MSEPRQKKLFEGVPPAEISLLREVHRILREKFLLKRARLNATLLELELDDNDLRDLRFWIRRLLGVDLPEARLRLEDTVAAVVAKIKLVNQPTLQAA